MKNSKEMQRIMEENQRTIDKKSETNAEEMMTYDTNIPKIAKKQTTKIGAPTSLTPAAPSAALF